jgi:hypothetical protein
MIESETGTVGESGVTENVSIEPDRCQAEARCPMAGAFSSASWFVRDYIDRHRHPLNASLHILGVPATFAGLYYVLSGRSLASIQKGMALVFVGYLLQYLGHRAQGNEVGELTLIKGVYGKLKKRINF